MTMTCRSGFAAGLAGFAILAASETTSAINLHPSASDLDRVVALARWPHTDDDRAKFHSSYTFPIKGAAVDGWVAERVEVITELRRAELMAEDHARINDSWGRAGMQEVINALQPWRTIETSFDGAAMGQTTRSVRILLHDKHLADVIVDFRRLD